MGSGFSATGFALVVGPFPVLDCSGTGDPHILKAGSLIRGFQNLWLP